MKQVNEVSPFSVIVPMESSLVDTTPSLPLVDDAHAILNDDLRQGVKLKFSALKREIHKGQIAATTRIQKELHYHMNFFRRLDRDLGKTWKTLCNAQGEIDWRAVKKAAKLLRDQALVDMAYAGYILDEGSDLISAEDRLWGTASGRNQGLPGVLDQAGYPIPRGFDGVVDSLKLAETLDPEHEDLKELWQLCSALTSEVRGRRNIADK